MPLVTEVSALAVCDACAIEARARSVDVLWRAGWRHMIAATEPGTVDPRDRDAWLLCPECVSTVRKCVAAIPRRH